jgi:hypothetical protein
MVNVANVKRNTDAAYVQLCRLLLQLMRVYFTAPQRVRYVGEGRGVQGATLERGATSVAPVTCGFKRGAPRAMMPLSVPSSVWRVTELDLGHEGTGPAGLYALSADAGRAAGPGARDAAGQDVAAGARPDRGVGLRPARGRGRPEKRSFRPRWPFAPLPVDDDQMRAMVRYRELSHAMERRRSASTAGSTRGSRRSRRHGCWRRTRRVS